MLCYNVEHNLSWNVTGQVKPCNWLDTFPGSVSIEEMKNRSEYRLLQADNANDVKNNYCQKCWDKELLNQVSKRQFDNKINQTYLKLKPNFVKIDAAIGDRCNAACVICGPDSSTLWQKELYGKILRVQSKTELWEEIYRCQDNILQIDFGGGEPWLNDVEQQIKVLTTLIQNGVASKIKLRYNSNGSIYPKQLIDCFDKFRQVEITLSIDDIESRFEYNRFPLKWDSTLLNLSQLIDLEKNNAKIKLTINYTISVFTFLYAQDFEQYSQQLGITDVHWNILHSPQLFNIKSLPLSCKQQVSESNIFYKLIANNPMENWNEMFFSAMHRLDSRRGTDFKQTFPELYSLLT